jgi:glycosyltransferase involved in cell wall biosynthesis
MKVSVIVCTFNRAHGLKACLDSIAASILAARADGEIVVVDNASTDGTAVLIRQWAETCPVPAQTLFEPKQGVCASRNCGARAARGDLLVFTDDDCRLGEGHIADALRHDAADEGFILRGGRVELGDPADLPLTIQTHPGLRYWHLPENEGKRVHLGGGMILGCNMTMRRALFEKLGLYDERIGAGTSIPGADDTDYIFRAYLAGVRVEYVPDMTVCHHHGRRTPGQARTLMRNYAISAGALYAKYLLRHPNLRAKLSRAGWKSRAEQLGDAGLSHVDISKPDKVFHAAVGALNFFIAALRAGIRERRAA